MRYDILIILVVIVFFSGCVDEGQISYDDINITTVDTDTDDSRVSDDEKVNVMILTDKEEYEDGDTITATLDYSGKIYAWGESAWSIDRWEDGKWTTIKRNGEKYFWCANIPDCNDVSLGEIKECPPMVACEREIWYLVGDAPKMVWDQWYQTEEKTFQCRFIERLADRGVTSDKTVNRSCAVFEQAPPGKYRVRFEYAYDINEEDIFERDVDIRYAEKEFVIKGERVRISTDKNEYNMGETVKTVFEFDDELYVNPYFKIFFYANHTWNFIGMWDSFGEQYTCCGLMPLCEKQNVTQAPIEILWDQKVVEEEIPVLPGDEVTRVQVEPGRYKISAVYGDDPVCIESVDVEFVIR